MTTWVCSYSLGRVPSSKLCSNLGETKMLFLWPEPPIYMPT